MPEEELLNDTDVELVGSQVEYFRSCLEDKDKEDMNVSAATRAKRKASAYGSNLTAAFKKVMNSTFREGADGTCVTFAEKAAMGAAADLIAHPNVFKYKAATEITGEAVQKVELGGETIADFFNAVKPDEDDNSDS